MTPVPTVQEFGDGSVLLRGRATVEVSLALRHAIKMVQGNGILVNARILGLAAVFARQAELVEAGITRADGPAARRLTVAEVALRIDRGERTARRVTERLGYKVGGQRFIDEAVLEEYLAER